MCRVTTIGPLEVLRWFIVNIILTVRESLVVGFRISIIIPSPTTYDVWEYDCRPTISRTMFDLLSRWRSIRWSMVSHTGPFGSELESPTSGTCHLLDVLIWIVGTVYDE